MNNNFAKTLILTLLSSLPLVSCSSIMEPSAQEMTVYTPGADEAVCYLQSNGHKYRLFPGETRRVMTSDKVADLRCLASGNREKTVKLKSSIVDSARFDVATAGAGFLYDHFSKALYKYPEKVVVDFSDIPETPYMPQYSKSYIHYPIESYGPSLPKVEGDDIKPKSPLKKKRGNTTPSAEGTKKTFSKGRGRSSDLDSTINSILYDG